ncbi:ABC transporter permease [Salmonirosea aquatica]|uniref:FtsX-like permease family protein n=1 Tax=Salmonirosea aquatica TaxID=2654236 RepID=A0A7C9B9T5_9BACT|nr:FtsX-like permease family protein [Cytophagaceae bacterium SJW1-29]
MIKFLFKGILRDKSRSQLPILIVSIGVALTVLLSGYIRGVLGDVVNQSARFETGHVKVTTRAYLENKDQLPNDLALLDVEELITKLKSRFPQVVWEKRIRFGGLLDAPDQNGLTKGQGPAAGIAVDLLSGDKTEIKRMNIPDALVSGKIPTQSGEAIIGADFAKKLEIGLGDEITYVGTTMNGSMTFQNFRVAGTIRFGAPSLDKGAIIVDIQDAQRLLDMPDATGELLGFFPNEVYDDDRAEQMAGTFNAGFANDNDEFAPIMQTLKQQNNLASLIDYAESTSGLFVALFVLAMSVVLWNTGLLGGLRRYQEFGIRLALGESKGQIYGSLLLEAVLIGTIGSVVGTVVGLAGTLYLQTYGIDIGRYLDNATMMMPSVVRARVSPDLFVIGFTPGLFAMVLGNMLSGLAIYRRETATLIKELEV